MAHSYRKDGPNQDQILFNPDTRVLTIGGYSVTLPASGATIASSSDLATVSTTVTNLGDTVTSLSQGVGFDLPTADGAAGVLWNDANVVKVST